MSVAWYQRSHATAFSQNHIAHHPSRTSQSATSSVYLSLILAWGLPTGAELQWNHISPPFDASQTPYKRVPRPWPWSPRLSCPPATIANKPSAASFLLFWPAAARELDPTPLPRPKPVIPLLNPVSQSLTIARRNLSPVVGPLMIWSRLLGLRWKKEEMEIARDPDQLMKERVYFPSLRR